MNFKRFRPLQNIRNGKISVLPKVILELFTLPTEIHQMVLDLLDPNTIYLIIPAVCKFFRILYMEYCQRHGHQEKVLFCEQQLLYNDNITSSILNASVELQNLQRPRRFFSNVDIPAGKTAMKPDIGLPFEIISKPTELQIHIFTDADSESIKYDEILSMVIQLPNSNDLPLDIHDKTSEFLCALFKCPFVKLKSLKLANLKLCGSLAKSLANLKLDWVCLKNISFLENLDLDSKMKILHFEVTSASFPKKVVALPFDLKGFSCQFSGLPPTSAININMFPSIHLKNM